MNQRSDIICNSLMSSGHRIHSAEIIAVYQTRAQAEIEARRINALNLCSERNILRPNSHLQRYWARVHREFVEKAK